MSVEKIKRVVLFNGPPGSGKDLCSIIVRNMLTGKTPANGGFAFNPTLMKFADPLKAAAHQLLAIPHPCEYYEKEFGNAWKNTSQPEFFGQTPRSEYIALSEDFIKPRHGDDVFGRIAARRIHLDQNNRTFIFSDSGFAAEAVPIIKLVGPHRVLVIELERNGCTYDGDSRGYVGAALKEQFPTQLNIVRLKNNDDQTMLTFMLKGLMAKYLSYQAEF